MDRKRLVLKVVPKAEAGEGVLQFSDPKRGEEPGRVDYICGACDELLVSLRPGVSLTRE